MQLGSGVKCTFSEASNSARREAENSKCLQKYPQQLLQVRLRQWGIGGMEQENKKKQTPSSPHRHHNIPRGRKSKQGLIETSGKEGMARVSPGLGCLRVNYLVFKKIKAQKTILKAMSKNPGHLRSKGASDHLTTWPRPFSPSRDMVPAAKQSNRKLHDLRRVGRQGIHLACGKAGLNLFGVLLPDSALSSKPVICKGSPLAAQCLD